MKSSTPILYLVLFWVSCSAAILYDLVKNFNSSLESAARSIQIRWSVAIFFIGTCLYRIFDAYNLVRSKKITQFDYLCLTVHNCFALIQLCSGYVLFYLGAESALFSSALMIADWSMVPFFFWILVWTRFIRRGW